jgi:hypothetical protein
MTGHPIGFHERQRQEAEQVWLEQNPGKMPVAVLWAGGDLWRVVYLGGCGYVDLAPKDEPSYQPGFAELELQGGLF